MNCDNFQKFVIRWFSTILLFSNINIAFSQNRNYAQHLIDTLASKSFYGRGYVNNGDQKAAKFIANEYSAIGIKTFDNIGYFQNFEFPVIVFSKKCKVSIDGKKLKAGKDFIVNPASKSLNKKLKIKKITDFKSYTTKYKSAIMFDTSYKFQKNDYLMAEKYKLQISLQKKLTWSISTGYDKNSSIDILKNSISQNPKKIKVNIKSKLKIHTASNVIGYIEGKTIKDTFIVITAHYDHLGMMGDVMFPGANDNASGTAMMLDLAKYFVTNPYKYSIAFIAFAGEEAGLIGSKHYTDNPLEKLPLSKIKFLINLDLMGSGEKGMAVVNASIFYDYFNKLQIINKNKNYLTGFKVRGKASNSDHYWFTERGVKCFFFYLMGSYSNYHDIFDNAQNLKLTTFYDKSFLLIKDFIESF